MPNKTSQIDIVLEEEMNSLRRTLKNLFAKEVENTSLPISHLIVLGYLLDKDALSMKDISEHLCIKPSSATSLIEGMAKKGFVERIHSAEDRRLINIRLTPKAVLLTNKIKKEKVEIMKEKFGRLNNNEKKQLIRIVRKITQE